MKNLQENLATLTIIDQATWQHPRENHRHVRGSQQIYDVGMAQFVLKVEKLSHIMGTAPIMISARLRSPSPIMAPVDTHFFHLWTMPKTPVPSSYNSFDPSNLNFQRMTTKTGYEASLCRYLRVTDWEYREWLDRFEKSEILKLCSKNTFRELLSKILFRVS